MKYNKKLVLILSLAILLGVVFYGGLIYGQLRANENRPLQPPPGILSLEASFQEVSKKVSPAVVNINTEKVIKRQYNVPMNEDFFKGLNAQLRHTHSAKGDVVILDLGFATDDLLLDHARNHASNIGHSLAITAH